MSDLSSAIIEAETSVQATAVLGIIFSGCKEAIAAVHNALQEKLPDYCELSEISHVNLAGTMFNKISQFLFRLTDKGLEIVINENNDEKSFAEFISELTKTINQALRESTANKYKVEYDTKNSRYNIRAKLKF